jgi:site-specific DNA-methyltransferase (adenine-specific)
MSWSGVGPGRIKWNKGVAKGMSFKPYEVAYCSMISGEVEVKLLWAGMQQAKSITDPMVQQGNKKLNEKRIHPCHKPVLLYQKLFYDFACDGYSILDTHLGSGSSRIAADKAGLDFVGFEIDEKYFDAQEKRYQNFKSQLQIPYL